MDPYNFSRARLDHRAQPNRLALYRGGSVQGVDEDGWPEQAAVSEAGWPYDETETNGYRSHKPVASEPRPSSRNIFGEHLRELRQAAGLTQQTLAERVGVSAAMLSHLEAGRRGASAGILTKLEEALGLKAEQLEELDFIAQIAGLSPDHQRRIQVSPQPSGTRDVVSDMLGLARPGKPGKTPDAYETTLLDHLRDTQFRSALDGHFQSQDRISTMAAVLAGLNELDSDDLLRVNGFLAGLKAARSEAPKTAPRPTNEQTSSASGGLGDRRRSADLRSEDDE